MTVPPRILRQRRRRIALRLAALFSVAASIGGGAGWASRPSHHFVTYMAAPWCSTGWRDPRPSDAKLHGLGLTTQQFGVMGNGIAIVTVPEPYREVTLRSGDILNLVCDGAVSERCQDWTSSFTSPFARCV